MAKVKEEVLRRIDVGMKILELADFIEKRIIDLGGKPAFPVNISINEIAAHYTPTYKDERVIEDGDLVKIDLGAHIDGYIGDMAFTWCSKPSSLIRTAEKAIENVILKIRPGITIGEISKIIEDTIKGEHLGPIVNLTGHNLDRFSFHGNISIPNVATDSKYEFKEGDVICLEPFVAPTPGFVKETTTIEIYRYLQDRPVRLFEAREILQMAKNEFNELPFAKRWLFKKFSPLRVSLALRQLEAVNALQSFPVLREVENKPVAQAEHTIIVAEEPIVTTKLK